VQIGIARAGKGRRVLSADFADEHRFEEKKRV
jgi:hypothetical protein